MSTAREISQIVDEFEAAWQTGEAPRIADFTDRLPQNMQAELLAALIPLDLNYCRKRGEAIDQKDYSVFGPEAVAIARRELGLPSFQTDSFENIDVDAVNAKRTADESPPSILTTPDVAAASDTKPGSIKEQLKELRLRQALIDLDTHWLIDREQYYVQGEDGKHAPPTPDDYRKQTKIATRFAGVWLLALAAMHIPFLSSGIGALMILSFDVFVVFGFVHATSSYEKYKKKVTQYSIAEADYQSKRKKLTDQIGPIKQSGYATTNE